MKKEIALASALLFASSGVAYAQERRPISVGETRGNHHWYYDNINKVEDYLATRKVNNEGVKLGEMLPFPYVNSRLILLPSSDGVYIGYFVDFKGTDKTYKKKGAFLALDGFVPEEIIYGKDGEIDEVFLKPVVSHPDGELDYFVSTDEARLPGNQLEVLLAEFDAGRYRDFDSDIPLHDNIQRNYHASLNVVNYWADLGEPLEQLINRTNRYNRLNGYPFYGDDWFIECWNFGRHYRDHRPLWLWHSHTNPYHFVHRRPIVFYFDGNRYHSNHVNRNQVIPDDSTRIQIPRELLPRDGAIYRGEKPPQRVKPQEGATTRPQKPSATKPRVIVPQRQVVPRATEPTKPLVRSTTTRRAVPVVPKTSPPPSSSGGAVHKTNPEKK